MTIVSFYDPLFLPPENLTYSVIISRFNGKWIQVRHHNRITWEIPGGHIEADESPDEAAARELKEETGAEEFNLDCVATYSVEKDGYTGYGRLFFAEVTKMGELPWNSEIAETIMTDQLPEDLTFPDIQPHLFQKINEYLKTKS
jgi:8-oxo-dGTP diphosphatase